MNEQEFQILLSKIESIWSERGNEITDAIELLQFHFWLDEQEKEKDYSYSR